jgi:hypothetical protein
MVVRGFTLFNAGEYWKAHEALEEAWLEEQGQVRHLYRGILQVAVTYYHIQRGNFAGAVKVYARSKRWLDPFPDICRGVDVKGLRRHLEQVMLEVYRLGPDNLAELDPHLLQPIRWSEESK